MKILIKPSKHKKPVGKKYKIFNKIYIRQNRFAVMFTEPSEIIHPFCLVYGVPICQKPSEQNKNLEPRFPICFKKQSDKKQNDRRTNHDCSEVLHSDGFI